MKSNLLKYFLGFFIASLSIILFSYLGYLNPIEGLIGKVFSPVVSFINKGASIVKEIGKSADDLDFLVLENQNLKKNINDLNLEISTLREAQIENESLKKQLGFIGSTKYKTLASTVITREPSNFLKTVVIDKGSKDGVKKDMAVVSEGFLIGRIIEVNSNTSKLMLLTDSNFGISAIVQESRALGLVKGQIGSGVVMETIPKDKNVKAGDTIITANLEDGIPEGLLIGKINDISDETSGLFQKASISPFVNLEEIKNVFIILI